MQLKSYGLWPLEDTGPGDNAVNKIKFPVKKLIRIIINTIPRPWLIRLSYLFIPISRLYFKGKNLHCPVCNGNYRKFLPYGYSNIRNGALCPGCLSLERHRVMWMYLNERTNFFSERLKVLHIAPEQCFLKRFRKLNNLEYHTADLESPIADYKCDVQKMPFKDNTYDIVICNHVLEHVPDDMKAMKEILRVIKPGGFSIMQVPTDFSRPSTFEDNSITDQKERTRIFGQYDHVRVYGTDYPERLLKAGFQIEEKNYIDLIDKVIKVRYSIDVKDFMFSCKKPIS